MAHEENLTFRLEARATTEIHRNTTDFHRIPLLLAAAAAVLVTAGTATAASPIYWTPAKAASLVQHANVAAVDDGKLVTEIIQPGLICRGTGKPVKRRYKAFVCRGQAKPYQADVAPSPLTVWAHPWPGRLCTTTVSAATCAAAPAVNDPRFCGQPALAVDFCSMANAREVMRRHLGGPGGVFQGDASCLPSGPLRFACTAGDAAETVVYRRTAHGWTATVTP